MDFGSKPTGSTQVVTITMIEFRSGTVDFIHKHTGEFAVSENICVFECEGFTLKSYLRHEVKIGQKRVKRSNIGQNSLK